MPKKIVRFCEYINCFILAYSFKDLEFVTTSKALVTSSDALVPSICWLQLVTYKNYKQLQKNIVHSKLPKTVSKTLSSSIQDDKLHCLFSVLVCICDVSKLL